MGAGGTSEGRRTKSAGLGHQGGREGQRGLVQNHQGRTFFVSQPMWVSPKRWGGGGGGDLLASPPFSGLGFFSGAGAKALAAVSMPSLQALRR